MSSLVQLYGGFDELLFRIEENGGELTPELETELEALSETIAKKVDNAGLALAQKEKEIEGLKQFKKSIDGGIKSAENTVKNFKAFLAKVCQRHGETTKEGKKFLKGQVIRFGDITRKVRSVEFDYKVPIIYKDIDVRVNYDTYKNYLKEKYPDLESKFVVDFKMPLSDYLQLEKEIPDYVQGLTTYDVSPNMDRINAAETLPEGCKETTVYNVRVDKKKGVEVKPSYEAINE
jgi:hypothetical protein